MVQAQLCLALGCGGESSDGMNGGSDEIANQRDNGSGSGGMVNPPDGTDTEPSNVGSEPKNIFVEQLSFDLGTCMPRSLWTSDDGRLSACRLTETVFDGDCTTHGRSAASLDYRAAIIDSLEETGYCGGSSGTECSRYVVCEILELEGQERQACLQDTAADEGFDFTGFCYVDPSIVDEAGNYIAGGDALEENQVVAHCDATMKRVLRLLGEQPPEGALNHLNCTLPE